MNSTTREFRRARDFLLHNRLDYAAAAAGFRWPAFEHFNFALDWFDVIAESRQDVALRIVGENDVATSRTYPQLARSSAQVANFLRAAGLRRGDAILVMLPNCAALWEVLLGAIKLGAVVIPTATLLSDSDLADRLDRGGAKAIVCMAENAGRFDKFRQDRLGICVGGAPPGWLDYSAVSQAPDEFEPDAPTPAHSPLLLYFTSGTTSRPKLVLHSHVSYPVGHLSTMYWIGLQPGDVHLNISSAGWAKHAWSSVFAPWAAEATVLVLNQSRFDAKAVLDTIARERVSTFCAPPTVWRMLVQQDLSQCQHGLRELVSAGEPLNPEIIAHVQRHWNLTIRDGYGQTETTAQIGNTPGESVRAGTMGRPLPGYSVLLRDEAGDEATEGEICIELGAARPLGMMLGYQVDGQIKPIDGAHFGTGDTASVEQGCYTYVGRADDVFKASDYRISPFELESALIEHPDVAEAGVVPSPDPVRLAVPKAFVMLIPGARADAATARSILDHARKVLGPVKRIRRIEFAELPKTISGKIRRVELRRLEAERRATSQRGALEWTEEDFYT